MGDSVASLAVVQAVGGPTPLLVKTDKAVAEHKAARESWAIGLGEGCCRRRCDARCGNANGQEP